MDPRRRTMKPLMSLWIVHLVVTTTTTAFVLIPPGCTRANHPLVVPNAEQKQEQLQLHRSRIIQLYSSIPPDQVIIDSNDDDEEEDEEDDDDDDEDSDSEGDDEEPDPYIDVAQSEFVDGLTENKRIRSTDMIAAAVDGSPTTRMDWGGALGKLRERVQDVESGDSQNPSKALFRLLSSPSPNQVIGSFVNKANPQVVQAMTGAVTSLLGGLSNPATGVEVIVKGSGEKIGSLCFQLQMTGYMFRNAEYVMALKEILDLSGSATLEDYKDAFDRLDKDGSGFIESNEVKTLLDDVYKGDTPSFEVETFVKFFDEDNDGRVSWEEFKRGLGSAMAQDAERKSKIPKLSSSNVMRSDEDDEDDEEEAPEIPTSISGTLEIEMDDGETVLVDAAEYVSSLKKEAQILKEELRREKMGDTINGQGQVSSFLAGGGGGGNPSQRDNNNNNGMDSFGGIASYIASRKGDIKALTDNISPEIIDTMKLLVSYVLEGGESGKGKGRSEVDRAKMSMEIPASALQQLALWQLILGYQLREQEAKGDYLKLLE